MSCTSNVSDPGDSANTSFVFGRNASRDGCAGQRIVVADVDAEATQVVVAEAPRRTVDGVGDEQVITGREQRQQR